jgi:hypothetical protein
MAVEIRPTIVDETPRLRRYASATRDVRERLFTILGKASHSISANTGWATCKLLAAPMMIVAVVITMLWLIADEFGVPASSRWPQRDNPTAILRLLFVI